MTLAADAAKDGATALAKAAWSKIKAKLGWTADPAPDRIEAEAVAALTANPALARDIEQIVNDYRVKVGGPIGTIDAGGASIGTVKQANVANNSGTINL